jgi:aminopeptidase N
MHSILRWLALMLAALAGFPAAGFGLSHDIDISIFPADRSLRAVDRVRIDPTDFTSGEIRFLINRNLIVEDVRIDSRQARWYSEEDLDPDLFMSDPDSDDIDLIRKAMGIFIVLEGDTTGSPSTTVTIEYSGVVSDSLEAPSQAYARGFSTTSGLIEERGVFLANQTLWYPFAFDHMFTFKIRVDVPYDWMVVSQGTREDEYVTRTGDEERVVTVWREANPTPELYLVAGRYYRHEDHYGRTRVMTYTFEESDSLARVYLDATKRYLAMYQSLIGEYPYGKFALVENFWQTGYGMPSFTLLGSRVIRLPFIVHTSYGHEILHNWWGNSVYVDYASGNWCEGLTTYGADYLYKEQMGEEAARAYRHETLMAFSNNVKGQSDFPLSEFRERHNAASQSVGYGKSLMVFHMLRKSLGDSLFWDALREFYRRNRFTIASWDDLEATFSEAAGSDLAWYFHQWVNRTGGPLVSLADAGYREGDGRFLIDFTLRQESPQFVIDLPVRIITAGGSETRMVRLAGTDTSYTVKTDSEPRRLAVDPDYETFRMLHPEEIPITLGTLFGCDSLTAVIGNRETGVAKEAFRRIAMAWGLAQRVVDEADYSEARMAGENLWLMGRGDISDRMLARVAESLPTAEGPIRTEDLQFTFEGGALILTLKNPRDENLGVGIFLADDAEASISLAGRLPHYSKYSYLQFTAGQPVLKGTWEEEGSPLSAELERR